VDRTLIQALADFHAGMTKRMASPQPEGAKADFGKALGEALQARDLARKSFGEPIDPAGGEVGAQRTYSERLVSTIQQRLHPDRDRIPRLGRNLSDFIRPYC
jgi:hypothetical protein